MSRCLKWGDGSSAKAFRRSSSSIGRIGMGRNTTTKVSLDNKEYI